jgi:hypothetical protein
MSLRLEHVLAPVVVALDYAALSWFPRLATMTGRPEAAFRVGTVVFIVVNAGVLLLGHRALPAWTTRWWGLQAATAPSATSRVEARWIAFVVLAAAGIGYRLSAIARTPLDPQQADMLPLIAAAGRKLLAGGNPYHRANPFQAGVDALDARPAPSSPAAASTDLWFPYVPPWLPALWLPYVPATWAGIDLRLIGLLAALLTAGLLGVARWSRPTGPDRTADEPPTAWLRLASAGGLLLAPAAVWFGAIGHTQTYWLYLTGLLWALGRRWWGLAGVCLGLCVMSRHTVLPLVPILGLYAWRCAATRERRAMAIGAAVVVVAVALPFGVEGLWQFTIGTPIWYMRFGDQGWNGPRWWVTHTFGLGAFLYPVGLSRALPWVGASLLAVVYGLAYRRVHDLQSCVRYLALILLVVQVSVPTPFRYEFFPIILVLSALPLLARAWPDGVAAVT